MKCTRASISTCLLWFYPKRMHILTVCSECSYFGPSTTPTITILIIIFPPLISFSFRQVCLSLSVITFVLASFADAETLLVGWSSSFNRFLGQIYKVFSEFWHIQNYFLLPLKLEELSLYCLKDLCFFGGRGLLYFLKFLKDSALYCLSLHVF